MPSVEVVVASNHALRADDEWFDEPDELERVQRILDRLADGTDPVTAAALGVSRLTQSQAFTEGNKRTAVLVGRWIFDRNGLDGAKFILANDSALAQLLLQAVRGADVSKEIVELFNSRRWVSRFYQNALDKCVQVQSLKDSRAGG